MVATDSGESEKDRKLAGQLMAKRSTSSATNMLATHLQQADAFFGNKWWMTATSNGQDNSTVALQDERGKKGGSVKTEV